MPEILVPCEKVSMRESGHDGSREVVIPSDPAEARRVQDDIEQALKACEFEERDIFSIKLALEEALVNAIKHGNNMDRSKKVRIAYRVSPERFDVFIADEGAHIQLMWIKSNLLCKKFEKPS